MAAFSSYSVVLRNLRLPPHASSNDLANGLTLEQILENKKEMYALFLKNMPGTKLVVMSGLPLPGRQELWADTVKTNEKLR